MLPRWLLWITLLLLARRGQPEPPSPLSVGQELWTVVIHERPARGVSAASSASSASSASAPSSTSSSSAPSARHAPRPPRQVLVAIISAYFDQPLRAQDGSAGVAPSEAAPPPRLLCRGLGGPGGAISAHATAARANGSALADDDLDHVSHARSENQNRAGNRGRDGHRFSLVTCGVAHDGGRRLGIRQAGGCAEVTDCGDLETVSREAVGAREVTIWLAMFVTFSFKRCEHTFIYSNKHIFDDFGVYGVVGNQRNMPLHHCDWVNATKKCPVTVVK